MFDVYMGVSKNRCIPKSSILIGFSIINHPFWGTPFFGNTHIYIYIHSTLAPATSQLQLLPYVFYVITANSQPLAQKKQLSNVFIAKMSNISPETHSTFATKWSEKIHPAFLIASLFFCWSRSAEAPFLGGQTWMGSLELGVPVAWYDYRVAMEIHVSSIRKNMWRQYISV